MRHRKRKRQLGRTGSERKAMLNNMAASILIHQRIETTTAKAKEVRRVVEKLITLSKNPTVYNRRQAYAVLQDRDLVKLLFDKIAPLFKDRAGGYTRIMHSRNRHGDGAEMAILELTEFREGKIAKTRPEKDQAKENKKDKEKAEAGKEKTEPRSKSKKEEEKTEAVEEPQVKVQDTEKVKEPETKKIVSKETKEQKIETKPKPKKEDKEKPEKKGFFKSLFGKKKAQ
ncbi:MAG: 50S ribosomal protein L17 [Candidatus Omnitrophica bacterium]|nr:50S ribosomal protein L17 [Candidatus Omnitrophota bacterium]